MLLELGNDDYNALSAEHGNIGSYCRKVHGLELEDVLQRPGYAIVIMRGRDRRPPPGSADTGRQLGFIIQALTSIARRIEDMAGELDALKAAVAANTNVISSAITLLQGLKQKLDDAIAANDPAALAALSAELGAQDQALADAVAANTPAG